MLSVNAYLTETYFGQCSVNGDMYEQTNRCIGSTNQIIRNYSLGISLYFQGRQNVLSLFWKGVYFADFADMNFRSLCKRLGSSMTNVLHTWKPKKKKNIQSTLVISKSKGLSKILRDIRTSTNQICRNEEKNEKCIEQPNFTNEYVIWLLKLEIHWKYCGKEEKLLLMSNFSSFPQYFVTCC